MKEKKSFRGTFPLFIISVLLIVAGELLGNGITGLLEVVIRVINPVLAKGAFWITASLYLTFIGTWVVVLLFLYFTKENRPILSSLGTKTKGNTIPKFIIGLLIGGGANAICIAVAYGVGDIKLYFDAIHPLSLVLMFLAVLIQSSAEELVCRVYLYQKLKEEYGGRFWPAAVLNALLFAMLHLGNPGCTILSLINIFLSGIMFSMMVYYMDSVWAAFAGHAAWNFTQNIIFGLPNSGNVTPYSILKLEASTARDSFAYNVGFGVEGTILADLVLVLVCIGLYLWGRRRGDVSIGPVSGQGDTP